MDRNLAALTFKELEKNEAVRGAEAILKGHVERASCMAVPHCVAVDIYNTYMQRRTAGTSLCRAVPPPQAISGTL